MAQLSYNGMVQLLRKHVVELVFVRRHEKPNWNIVRRMLCTNDRNLLLSLPGRLTLKYRPPWNFPPYDAKEHNLVVAYDIMWLDYRAIPVEGVQIVSAMPTHNKKDQEIFWEYFTWKYLNMASNEKEKFMNK